MAGTQATPRWALPSAKRKPRGAASVKARERFAKPLPDTTDEELARQRALFERHDQVEYAIRLPLSPTVNNYRAVVRGRLITSAEGREYHAAVKQFWIAHWNGWPPEPLTGRIRLCVEVCFPTARVADVSNRIKALEDALTAAGAWEDDSQIDDLHFRRGAISRGCGYCDVWIETLE
jgi:crossover junction endodeoxyribonuclease RusA